MKVFRLTARSRHVGMLEPFVDWFETIRRRKRSRLGSTKPLSAAFLPKKSSLFPLRNSKRPPRSPFKARLRAIHTNNPHQQAQPRKGAAIPHANDTLHHHIPGPRARGPPDPRNDHPQLRCSRLVSGRGRLDYRSRLSDRRRGQPYRPDRGGGARRDRPNGKVKFGRIPK
jgi:hypothetical protein